MYSSPDAKVQPKHLLLELLLASGDDALPVSHAVAAGAVFGISENHVRVTLARLAAQDMVLATERGAWRLGPAAQSLAQDVANWRSTAIRQRLHALGLEPQAVVCGCTSLDAATEAAVDALWDGATLNHAYRATQERLQRWLDGAARLPIDQAARESFFLGGAAIRQLVYDPLLPEPMVDAALRQAFIDSVHAFDAAGRTIWNRFYDTLPVPDTANRHVEHAADDHERPEQHHPEHPLPGQHPCGRERVL